MALGEWNGSRGNGREEELSDTLYTCILLNCFTVQMYSGTTSVTKKEKRKEDCML